MPPRGILPIIADLVGVSRWTVSKVLSGQYKRHGISDITVKTIIVTAQEQNYINDESDITNPFYFQIVKVIENALFNLRYAVIISSTGYDLDKVLR